MSSCCAARFPEGSERLDDDTFVYYPHRVGANVLICGKKNSRFPYQCFVGPEWPCMLCTVTLIIAPTYFFIKNVASNWGIWLTILAAVLASLTIIFYVFTACSDPGIVFIEKSEEESRLVASTHSGDEKESVSDIEMNRQDRESASGGSIFDRDRDSTNINPVVHKSSVVNRSPKPAPENLIECGHCQMKRPRNAHHCHECKLCIHDLDHHCPWTGKCIGKKNLSCFHNFLISLSTLICFVIIAVIYTAAKGYSVLGQGHRSRE
jgi:hypothetical protein